MLILMASLLVMLILISPSLVMLILMRGSANFDELEEYLNHG